MNRLLHRATWLKMHLYLALFIEFFFALMGLTGSISVYREAIDEFLNPQSVIEKTAVQRQSLDKIMLAIQNAHPDLTGAWTLEMPRTPHSMLIAWYDKPSKTFFELSAPLMVGKSLHCRNRHQPLLGPLGYWICTPSCGWINSAGT